MAFLDFHFFSDVLGLTCSAQVLIPQATAFQIGMGGGTKRATYPTLYLLHGLSDDHTVWMRRTAIERYAAARNLAVVMPAVGRSFYQDTASGANYWTFVSEELPLLCERFFPLSTAREERFAAGLSMGGYGALRLALARPERYAAAASLSGAVDVERRLRQAGRPGSHLSRAELVGIFGPELQAGDADLWKLAAALGGSGAPRPALYLCCGTEDPLLGENRAFRAHLASADLEATYEEGPGAHDWGYWDAQIQRVLEWLPLP